jgi:hypothetical protein
MHSIAIFISNKLACDDISKAISGSKCATLSQGFYAVVLFDNLGNSIWAENIPAYKELSCLKKEWASIAQAASQHGKVAYIETEYFGGEGDQGAILWDHSRVIFEPQRDSADTDEEPLFPINTVLNLLGVTVSSENDEFDEIGLGNVRKNEDFELIIS